MVPITIVSEFLMIFNIFLTKLLNAIIPILQMGDRETKWLA